MIRKQRVSSCARAHSATLAAILIAAFGNFVVASHATATLFLFTGTGSSAGLTGTADITTNPATDTITVVLTNTTTTTLDAADTFTGIDLTLGGLAVNTGSLTAKGTQRTVAGSGTFTDSAPNQNLSWSIFAQGGGYRLDFNPDAKDAIIGPPTGGNYSGANGSIKGNAGHTPFAALTGTFTFKTNGDLLPTTPINVTTFLFGTGPDPATGNITPEPSTALMALLAILWGVWKRQQ